MEFDALKGSLGSTECNLDRRFDIEIDALKSSLDSIVRRCALSLELMP